MFCLVLFFLQKKVYVLALRMECKDGETVLVTETMLHLILKRLYFGRGRKPELKCRCKCMCAEGLV